MSKQHEELEWLSRDKSKVTRIEVIDWTSDNRLGGGRVLTHWEPDTKVWIDLQDDNRTLKIFIEALEAQLQGGKDEPR